MNKIIQGSAICLLFVLASSCTTKHDSAPYLDDVQPKTNLSKERVISLANAEAEKIGYKLVDYESPEPKYEFTGQANTWTVFYEGKVKATGNHFLVWVNDETGECKLMPGE